MPEVVQLPLLVIRYRYVYTRSMRVMKTYNEDRTYYVLLSCCWHLFERLVSLMTCVCLQFLSEEIIIVDLATIVIIDS